jgi:uncharacterized membrane protein
MARQNQHNLKNQELNNSLNAEKKPFDARRHIINYTDIVLRSLIAFLVIGMGGYMVLGGIFHLSPIFILPIIFLVSVLVSPFLSRFRIGEKVVTKYEAWLEKMLK